MGRSDERAEGIAVPNDSRKIELQIWQRSDSGLSIRRD
jgi:hypothetical protein